jgi:hypothetical protein
MTRVLIFLVTLIVISGFNRFFFRLGERGMDRWRPGWRKRRASRRSPWDAVEFLLALPLVLLFWYLFFQAVWELHVHFYPSDAGNENEFWRQGAFVSSFLMTAPLIFPALTAAFLVSNLVMWLIPPARRAMDREAIDREMTFRGANLGLIKWGGIASSICFLLSLIGAATLRPLW